MASARRRTWTRLPPRDAQSPPVVSDRSSYSPSCRSRASPGRRGTNRRRDDGHGSPRLTPDASRVCDPGGRYTKCCRGGLRRSCPRLLWLTPASPGRDAHLPDLNSGSEPTRSLTEETAGELTAAATTMRSPTVVPWLLAAATAVFPKGNHVIVHIPVACRRHFVDGTCAAE